MSKKEESLRKKAEEIVKERRAETVTKLTEKENLKVLHELEVHQIELELQNEELMFARDKAEEISDKYVELYDFAPVGYFTLSREGDILGLNLLGAKMIGKDRSKIKKSNFALFLSVDSREVYSNFLENTFKSGKTENCEVTLLSDDGLTVNAHLIGVLSEEQDQCFLTALDITERIIAEKELKDNEEKYRTLFETERDSLFLIDKETFEILDVNDSACSMYGYSKKEMLKMKNYDVSAEPEKTIKFTQNLEERISLRYHKKKDGTVFPVDISANEILFRNRSVIFTAIRDITEQMKYEEDIVIKNEELERINAEKDKFFAIIAHDLRSPFTGFLGFTDLLKSDLKSISLNELQSIVNNMSVSAHNLFALLTNLLEWSMMQRGLTAFNPIKISVKDAVENVSGVFYDIANNKEVSLNIDLPENVFIEADKTMLETILRNLISNALKFSNKGGSVTISAESNKKDVNISVKDTGIGMDDELKSQIFRIDKKSGRKGTANEPSTGLGLLLCKEFAEKNNGKITIKSEVGKGSEFIVTFPVA
ncbi:MAG: PAS domain S-box protein [Ignavibacteriae bacterium]|nr:PAS domain S-box protein [Ignavibacteriota bacterium]